MLIYISEQSLNFKCLLSSGFVTGFPRGRRRKPPPMVAPPRRSLWERPPASRGGAEGATGPGNSQANGPQEDGSLESGGRPIWSAPTDEVSRQRRIFQVSGQRGSRAAQSLRRTTRLWRPSWPNCGPLKRTPLYDLHREFGARLVPFAGYEMPVQYPTGILAEHAQTRTAAGLFDVSHMGQVRLTAKPGQNAAKALETLVPGDITGLQPGQQRYTQFTNDAGGILDDLMITSTGDHLLMVVQRRLQGRRSRACAEAPRRDLRDRADVRPRASGAAGAAGVSTCCRGSHRRSHR